MNKKPRRGRESQLSSWWHSKREGAAFAARFGGVLLVGCLVYWTPLYQSALVWETRATAAVVRWLLALGGSEVVGEGAMLFRGSVPVLEVVQGCSGISLCWLLVAAVVAFPASLGERAVGVLVGVGVLLVWNVVRVVFLFLVGVHWPGAFAALHEQYWPIFSILATVALLAVWLAWLGRGKGVRV